MTVLAFTPDRNQKAADYSGAFKPEAKKFATHFNGQVVEVPLDKNSSFQRDTVLGAIELAPGPLECVAFFCHGFQNRIQLGFSSVTVENLAAALAGRHCSRVALYACSTGAGPGPGGDNGFADRLRDSMCARGLTDCRVLAHRTAGHTSSNPAKRFFEGMGSPIGGTGGFDVVSSSSSLWPKWAKRCRATKDLLRFRIMWMSVAEIHQELLQG